MRRGKKLAAASSLGLLTSLAVSPLAVADEQAKPTQTEVILTQVATATAPSAGAAGPGGTFWIAERAGTVRVLSDQGLGPPILDLSSETTTDGERGLVGITFDDALAHVYLSFTDLQGHSRVDEIAVVGGQPQLGTRRTVIVQEQPGSAHNAGDITFGPDGMLYLSLGDGDFSFEGDPFNNGQNLGTLLATVIRIDVTSGSPYAVPPDNPFVGVPGARGEIWAYGLRNPWRISFDAVTGDFWLGDVGQFSREEVNFLPAGVSGANFGWSLMEGTLPRPGGPPADHVAPLLEYNTVSGQRCSVTGGYVYRGSAIPSLQGQYVFSDWCEGDLRALQVQNGQLIQETNLGVNAGRPVAFVQGDDLELYVLDIAGGAIHRLDPAASTTPPTPTASPTAPPTTTPPPVVGDCAVDYHVDDWGGSSGFTATVSITNTGGSAFNGWSLAWDFPAGQSVNDHWNSAITQNGASVTATNVEWNPLIAPTQSVSFGFNGTAPTGANPPPTGFTLNGTSCTLG